MKKALLIVGFLIFSFLAIGQLPDVYNTGNQGFVSFGTEPPEGHNFGWDKELLAEYYKDFSIGDTIFAYITDNGDNKLIGKVAWENEPAAIVMFINESGPQKPGIRTGGNVGDIVKFGLLKNGNTYKLNLLRVTMLGNSYSEVSLQPMSLYQVYGVTLGEQLNQLSAIDYIAWLSAQCPQMGLDYIELSDTPAAKSDISLLQLKPKFSDNVTYSVAPGGGSGTIFKRGFTHYYKFEKDDLTRGYVNIIVQAKGNSNCSGIRMFSHQIKFPVLQNDGFENLTRREFVNMVKSLSLQYDSSKGILTMTDEKPWPDINIKVNSRKTVGHAPSITFNETFKDNTSLDLSIPVGTGYFIVYITQPSTGFYYFIRDSTVK